MKSLEVLTIFGLIMVHIFNKEYVDNKVNKTKKQIKESFYWYCCK